uniref:Uncharacterized protein n=1 Tax=Rhodnius prolixus TaxID=13249 RepID=T1IBS1_RHOPR
MNLVLILVSICATVNSQVSVDPTGKVDNSAKETKNVKSVVDQKVEDEQLIKQVFGEINRAVNDKVIKGASGKGFAVVEEAGKGEKEKKIEVVKNVATTQGMLKTEAGGQGSKISEVPKELEKQVMDVESKKNIALDVIKSGNEAINKGVEQPASNVISVHEYLPVYSVQMIPASLYLQRSWYL